MEQIRVNQSSAPQKSANTPRPDTSGSKAKKMLAVLLLIILALVLLLGGSAVAWKLKQSRTQPLAGIDNSKYQALFLTNGQVYFAKLSAADQKTIKAEDIYYLQVQQAVQPKPDPKNPNAAQQQGETSLVKLGQELHGPEDKMYIDRGQVLFWENLKDDGKVVQAINAYKK